MLDLFTWLLLPRDCKHISVAQCCADNHGIPHPVHAYLGNPIADGDSQDPSPSALGATVDCCRHLSTVSLTSDPSLPFQSIQSTREMFVPTLASIMAR